MDAAQQLVDGLQGLAVAGLVADDGQGGGEQFQDRPGGRERRGFGANHDQQVAFAGALGAAGKRCVNEGDAEFSQPRDGVRNGFRSHRAGQDDDGTRLQDTGHAILAKEDVIELFAVADGKQQGVRVLCGRAGRGKSADAGVFSEPEARFSNVEAVDGQLGGKARGHGQSHGAEAKDGDCVVRGHGVLH